MVHVSLSDVTVSRNVVAASALAMLPSHSTISTLPILSVCIFMISSQTCLFLREHANGHVLPGRLFYSIDACLRKAGEVLAGSREILRYRKGCMSLSFRSRILESTSVKRVRLDVKEVGS